VRQEQNLGFIVEWEKVVTPMMDHLSTLPEVDLSALALIGLRSVVSWPLAWQLSNTALQLLLLLMACTTLGDCSWPNFHQL
jgi:hypothetical protein